MEETKTQTIEEAIDEAWEKLFHLICDREKDLYDLKIIYQEDTTGKTIIRSWHDRSERLRENELNERKMT